MFADFKKLFKKQKVNIYDKQSLGKYGEDLAENFLKKQHYKILERNWRYKNDELDIICLDEKILVFVEVRLRSSNALVGGYDSVSKHKRTALRRAMEAYIEKHMPDIITYRLDVIEITLNKTTMQHELLHFENV